MKCRFCGIPLKNEFIDLVNAPPSNSFLTETQLNEPEIFYPLKLFVCESCLLVQIDEYKKSHEIFGKQYAYFSSYSQSWLNHARKYVAMISDRLGLNSESQVIEIASNDGYLLQYFLEKKIPCLGIEPTANTAQAAREKGIETLEDYFTCELAAKLSQTGKKADLLIGNNVFAHVPDINNFTAGMKKVLKKQGVITLEFPHLMQLIEQNQFDTIYHEHFSYFSFHSARLILKQHGLEVFDVEELSSHGGSLRIYAKHSEDATKYISEKVNLLVQKERSKGMLYLSYYKNFQKKVKAVKGEFVRFLTEQKLLGKKVAAYGAAAKGNTLFNYCGIKKDLVEYVVDASPHKQGMFLPGSHIPVVKEDVIKNSKPDYIIILPWNIREEIIHQLSYVKEWGCCFLIAVPTLEII